DRDDHRAVARERDGGVAVAAPQVEDTLPRDVADELEVVLRGPVGAVQQVGHCQALSSPRMNDSTISRASSSWYCTAGDFMKYAEGPVSGPPMPRSSASLQPRTASMITPAEFGESHTSSLSSMFSGTSPKLRPSSRM